MRWATVLLSIGLMSLIGCRSSAARSHETCVKGAIFAAQRATGKVSNAVDYADAVAAMESLKTETETLSRLRDELHAFPQPSSWERSRMRKHRSLLESSNAKWAAAVVIMRQRMEGGQFPPDLRQKLDDALTAFGEAHKQFWSEVEPFWN
jgi:hypothetical protein